MTATYITTLLQRAALPICILLSILVRPCLISYLYVLLLFWIPYVPPITKNSWSGHSGIFIFSTLIVSSICLIAQIGFQTAVYTVQNFPEQLENCSSLEILLSQIGFVTYEKRKLIYILFHIYPDLLMTLTSVILFFVCRKITMQRTPSIEDCVRERNPEENKSVKLQKIIVRIGRYVCLLLLCFTAILTPSVIGLLYFLIFLISMTLWACCVRLKRKFAIVLRIFAFIVFIHFSTIYFYQFETVQSYIPQDSPIVRYLAIKPIYKTSCQEPNNLNFDSSYEWTYYFLPFMLYFTYYIVILESSGLLTKTKLKLHGALQQNLDKNSTKKRPSKINRRRWIDASHKVRESDSELVVGETTPLLRRSTVRRPRSIDRSGSVYMENANDIPLEEIGARRESMKHSTFEHILDIIENILHIINQCSYILTSIVMITWSITYLSWLSFVFLLWANILWLIPNQRIAMLRSSPFLVAYAWFLLLSSYIYCINFTEEELPSTVQDINLSQIGFTKILSNAVEPLAIKCLYGLMFWITLRQYIVEKMIMKQKRALEDMAAPLQAVTGVAAGVTPEEQTSGMRMKVQHFVNRLLLKCWIWVVAITLFAVAITGERMTMFRIIYMALFLIFILSFQISVPFWRKIMFAFWLVVIVYSMLILVMVYTYQFDNFSNYWETYLHVPSQQQLDIGLEKFPPKILFFRLVTPSFFVVITVIQLHYFHKDFIEMSDMEKEPKEEKVHKKQKDEESVSFLINFRIKDLLNLNKTQVKLLFRGFKIKILQATNIFLTYLDIHSFKIILIYLFLMCCIDTAAVYVPIVLLVVIASGFSGRGHQIVVYIISIYVAIFLLSRMIFQIEYIDPSHWRKNCTLNNETVKVDDAEWLGFKKTTQLPSLLKWNMGFILIVTLQQVLSLRQNKYISSLGNLLEQPFCMFPSITRKEADENLTNMIKFFCNYGFYKFGVEICLCVLIIVIGIRMDVYAMLYSFWLILICLLKRQSQRLIWGPFVSFLTLSIVCQYLMVLGLPPGTCIQYIWEELHPDLLKNLQIWGFLKTNMFTPNKYRIIFDGILLLLVNIQHINFNTEKHYQATNREHPGGSNEPIESKIDEPDFVNPIPDYMTFTTSRYLDTLKVGFFCSLAWVTVTITFLAGTTEVTIFSLGYLIGTFVIFWEGSDLYLRPIKDILRLWNSLLIYNVFVIVIKTVFQLVGCLFIHNISKNICLIFKLFAIGCYYSEVKDTPLEEDTCTVPRSSTFIVFDFLCFVGLIFTKRMFRSYYFLHLVNEIKASTILASRGAGMIEQLRLKRMTQQKQKEKETLDKIRSKMERIKANQKKLGRVSHPSNNYYVEQRVARSSSMSSCTSAGSQHTSPAGYHTPIDDEEHPPLTPRSSSLQPQAPPSPYSAVMTVSLEGYLEPQRMSFSSPPNSDINPRPPSPDESFPVFSPPPYDAAPPYTEAVTETHPSVQRQSSIGPPWMQGRFVTPRPSIFSYSSKSAFGHREYGLFADRPLYRRHEPKSYKSAILSGDYYMFDDIADEDAEIEKEKHEEEQKAAIHKEKLGGKATLGRFLSTILKTDIDTAIRRHSESDLPPRRPPSVSSNPASAPASYKDRNTRTVIFDKPDTPTDQNTGDTSEKDKEEETPTLWQNILKIIVFIWLFIESSMLSITLFLNRATQDYRYISKALTQEKQILKENTPYDKGYRIGYRRIWQPAASYSELTKNLNIRRYSQSSQTSDQDPILSVRSDATRTDVPTISEVQDRGLTNIAVIPEIRILGASKEGGLDSSAASSTSERSQLSIEEFEEQDIDPPGQNIFLRLFKAIGYLILSRSELLAYFAIFLNQIKTATILSLPLPFLVFFWGSLTIPRPRKTFWVSIIAYTECVILIKCIFQFDIIPWNLHSDVYYPPFHPPKIIGVEKVLNFAVWDLILLLVVFFHRFILKCLGLWVSTPEPEPILRSGEYILHNDGEICPVDKSQDSSNSTTSSGEETDEDNGQAIAESEDKAVIVAVQTADPCITGALALGTNRYLEPYKNFFQRLMDPSSRVSVDVYSYMFLCDFFNFFVIIIGYSSFGTQKGDVSSYIKENRVPVLFLVMLITQFMLIIIDRGIYLTRNLVAKIIFQIVQIVFLHIWLFILFPIFTERDFTKVLAPQIYYIVKAFYLLLSAYQIRCGYPTRILGNFLCRGYNYVNMGLYSVFLMIPFLWELRTVMDWMWTDTTMSIFDWIKMEDIFSHIFLTKCSRYVENEFPVPRGTKKAHVIKYLMGGGFLVGLIGIIWFPLVFFSLGSAVGDNNVPYEVSLDVRLGPYEPVYHISAQSNSIHAFSDTDYEKLRSIYETNSDITSFLSGYDPSDIAALELSEYSANVWSISPPDRQRMVDQIQSTMPLKINLFMKILHQTRKPEDTGAVTTSVEIIMPPDLPNFPCPDRKYLLNMLKPESGEEKRPVSLQYLLPKFLKVTNRGTAEVLTDFMKPVPIFAAKMYRNMSLFLNSTNDTHPTEWWKFNEECDDYNDKNLLNEIPFHSCGQKIVIYTFNDKIFPAKFSVISELGIVGLYTTIVFVASRVLKGFFADQYTKIMFNDVPNIDRVYQLILNIYLVREAKEFALEEDLFAKLIFLFRSPETLIKWTRPKYEIEDGDDDVDDDEDDDDGDDTEKKVDPRAITDSKP